MMKGTDLARAAGATVHADIIDSFKEQMLIALIKQMGGHAIIPVKDIDGTGGEVMSMRLIEPPEGRAFEFFVEKKQ